LLQAIVLPGEHFAPRGQGAGELRVGLRGDQLDPFRAGQAFGRRGYAYTLASYRALQPPPAPLVGKSIPAPQPKLVAAARPAAARPTARAANECTTLSGVESLQCNRCSEKLGFARVTCHESVRLQYCETELGDERTCPSPIPQSYPG